MTTYSTLLTDRSLLSLQGKDKKHFLQTLISNDIDKVSPSTPLFTLLLTPQGKLLFDFIIWQHNDEYLIDCEKSHSQDLIKKLNFYKLRAEVTITLTPHSPYAIWGTLPKHDLPQDPRNSELGIRALQHIHTAFCSLESDNLENYHLHLIKNCIPQGQDTMPPDSTFPLDYGLHECNGIDFQKGCFIGQEVTSRSYRRGKRHKKLYTIKSEKPLTRNTKITSEGEKKQIGDIRNTSQKYALALLRQDSINLSLIADNIKLQLYK